LKVFYNASSHANITSQEGGEGCPRVSLLGSDWLIHRSMGCGICYSSNI